MVIIDTEGGGDSLYHITTERLANRITRDGFKAGIEYSKINEMIGEDVDGNPMSKVAQTRAIEHLIDEYRPEHINRELPQRSGAVFFWANRKDAEKIDVGNTKIIEVDSSKINCRGGVFIPQLVAPLRKSIFSSIFNDAPYDYMIENKGGRKRLKKGVDAPHSIKTKVKSLWEYAKEYKGQDTLGREVWFNCDIPPEAIVGVHEPTGEEYDIKGDISIEEGEYKRLENNVRDAFNKCKVDSFSNKNIEDVYLVGDYATGIGNKIIGEFNIKITTKEEWDTEGRMNSLTEEERKGKNETEVCMELIESEIIEGFEDKTIGASIDITRKLDFVYEIGMKQILGNDVRHNRIINLTEGRGITEMEMANSLSKTQNGMELLMTTVANQFFSDVDNHEERYKKSVSFVEDRYGV